MEPANEYADTHVVLGVGGRQWATSSKDVRANLQTGIPNTGHRALLLPYNATQVLRRRLVYVSLVVFKSETGV